MIKLHNSPAIMALGNSLRILSSNPDELCDKLKLILQEKQAGNNSDLINEETVAIFDKISEYKCISKKQHKQTLIKGYLLHTTKKKYKYSYSWYTRMSKIFI